MTQAKALFDQALSIAPGQRIVITCPTRGQMNSLRVLLSREKANFMAVAFPDFDIVISCRTAGSNYHVILEKALPVPPPIILNPDGTIAGEARFISAIPPSAPTPKTEDIQVIQPSEKERLIAAMKEDGLSDEEINTYFGNEPDEMSKIDVSGNDEMKGGDNGLSE